MSVFHTVLERPNVISLVSKATGTSLICWVTLGQHLLTLWSTKISRNMSISMHLRTCSSSGWVLMINMVLGSKSMDPQLSNALSTMLLRHLVMFLHFETYALANPQKTALSGRSGCQLDFLPHIYDARSQVKARISQIMFFFEGLREHIFLKV